MKLSQAWNSFGSWLEQSYAVGHNRSVKQQQRDLDDFFMIISFSEMLGLPNPCSFYMIDIMPQLVDEFHHWHRRLGLHNSIWERMPCGCC